MNKRIAEHLITQKGYKPYIAGHWLGKRKAGYIIKWKDHGDNFEYACNHQIGSHLLALAKGGDI